MWTLLLRYKCWS